MHRDDLRPRFHREWSGSGGRFQREIRKLEQNFSKKCSKKNSVARPSSFYQANPDVDGEKINSPEVRERRSSGQLRVAHNPGRRMRHIIHNVKYWTEEYLTGCKNQGKVIARWQRFVDRWEHVISKNPIFSEEFKTEERYLRNNNGPAKPCGRIFREFGQHGQYMELRDAADDTSYGIDDLGQTDFGNDELMSMIPFEGMSK